MKCEQCFHELKTDSVFCDKCGAKVKQEEIYYCKCGNELSPNTPFCGICGTKNELLTNVTPTTEKILSQNLMTHVQGNDSFFGFYISTTFWITILRIVSIIGLLVVMALGIYQWVKFADYGEGGFGFMIFLICTVIAFLCSSFTMVFLDLSKDMRKIRKVLENKE